ncbi:MAG: DUF4912 domain-containing protein [Elusimicrobiota bacterium]|nr:DUF4912 domain-containing protein [Endomicrobiia bacterium]MDW8165921.1 DUF4912 domain-containing protein [Elusimicrobiota bacterium]
MKEEIKEITSVSSFAPSSYIERKLVPTEISDLLQSYGDTKIVLLPRDPWWCFAYWEISEKVLSEIKNLYGENFILSIRVYDVTNVNNFDGKNANKFFDIDINNLQVNNWYINLPEVNRSWCVDLGVKIYDGRFITISRSNIVIMPRFGVSPLSDEQWAILQKEFERLLEMSGVSMIGKGSFDVAKLMRERWEELIWISQIPQFISSGFISSFAEVSQQQLEVKEFFLKADTELIIYGETKPDAKLYINGDEYKLSKDGRFSLRMHLSDEKKVIPIKAVSSDGSMQKQIIFVVTRETETK